MNNNNNGQGGFLQGLLVGLIIGGGAVFLLGTEKGKKLLRKITEEGIGDLSELQEFFEDEVKEYQDEKEDEEIKVEKSDIIAKKTTVKKIHVRPIIKVSPVRKVNQVNEVNTFLKSADGEDRPVHSDLGSSGSKTGGEVTGSLPPRRLFRGIHKRS